MKTQAFQKLSTHGIIEINRDKTKLSQTIKVL